MIAQARDIYLTYVSGSQSGDTIDQKRKAIGYLLEKFGDVPIDTLTVDMLEEWKRLLLERMQKSSVQACRPSLGGTILPLVLAPFWSISFAFINDCHARAG